MNQLEQFREQYDQIKKSHDELVKRLDVALNGENAAKQASLCDIVCQCESVKFVPDTKNLSKENDDLNAILLATNNDLMRALNREHDLKESLRYVIEQAIEWQNFATGCEQEETEEMKLAKERAK